MIRIAPLFEWSASNSRVVVGFFLFLQSGFANAWVSDSTNRLRHAFCPMLRVHAGFHGRKHALRSCLISKLRALFYIVAGEKAE